MQKIFFHMTVKNIFGHLKKHAATTATACIVAGVLVFAASFVLHTKSNILLFAGLLCIVVGTAGYVWALRQVNPRRE